MYMYVRSNVDRSSMSNYAHAEQLIYMYIPLVPSALATEEMASAEPTTKEQKLPEVPLGWSDFVWSLEKLRNKPYSKNTTERY